MFLGLAPFVCKLIGLHIFPTMGGQQCEQAEPSTGIHPLLLQLDLKFSMNQSLERITLLCCDFWWTEGSTKSRPGCLWPLFTFREMGQCASSGL